MPTIKPRFTVTMNPFDHEVISRLAALQGCTRGALVADLIGSIVPSLARTVALLEAAREAPEQVKSGLRAVVDSLHGELSSASGDASAQLDSLVDQRKALAPLGRAFCVGASPAGAPAKPGACASTLRS